MKKVGHIGIMEKVVHMGIMKKVGHMSIMKKDHMGIMKIGHMGITKKVSCKSIMKKKRAFKITLNSLRRNKILKMMCLIDLSQKLGQMKTM